MKFLYCITAAVIAPDIDRPAFYIDRRVNRIFACIWPGAKSSEVESVC